MDDSKDGVAGDAAEYMRRCYAAGMAAKFYASDAWTALLEMKEDLS